MTVYVPGTAETDPKKQNRAIQAVGAGVTQNTTDIATNTTNIATNTAAITALQGLASPIKNTLGADVALNNIANYFPGPTVAQGTTGTWFASGTVTFIDTGGLAVINCKLWDGTTVIASGAQWVQTNQPFTMNLSGYITSPAGNIRIDCRDTTNTTGKILFNASGNSKDSTLSVYRIA